MHAALLFTHWLLSVRALLELAPGEGIDAARVEIARASFWQVRVPERPAEDWRAARDRGAVRYRVLVEVGLDQSSLEFAAKVDDALGDSSGWSAAGREFVRVDERAEITVVLASPGTVDRLCRPLATRSVYSCGRGGRAVLNLMRWEQGSRAWTASLDEYRTYMVNHEVGHLLGMPHRECPEVGKPAPVMQQQTFGLDGCLPGSEPSSAEIAALRRRWR